MKNLTRIIRNTVWAWCWLCCLATAAAQNLHKDLAALGFENIRTLRDSSGCIIALENAAYKVQRDGVHCAMQYLKESGLLQQGDVTLILTDQNVPQVTLRAPKGATNVDEWSFEYGIDEAWLRVQQAPKSHSSLFRTDLRLYPQLYMSNYTFDRLYETMFELNPTLEVQLWRGAKLSAQVVIPVWNDHYTIGYREHIRPGYLTLEQKFLVLHKLQGSLTLGNFDQECFGGDLRLQYPLPDPHWLLTARVGVVGEGYFYKFSEFNHGSEADVYFSLGPDYYWAQYNTQLSLRGEKYLKDEYGVRFEAIRHFRYLSVGLYAQKSNQVTFNGGFRFIATLPLLRQRRHGYVPRIDLAPSNGLNFNAGSKETIGHYLMPYATASDNIKERNQFNPYFLLTTQH